MRPTRAITGAKAGAQRGGVVLAFMFLMLIPLVVLFVADLLDGLGDADVVARQPLGSVLRMSAAGGFSERLVIETTQGFYLLHGVASVDRGELLTLELRRSGRRYVCNTARSLCLETTREHFSVNPKSSQP